MFNTATLAVPALSRHGRAVLDALRENGPLTLTDLSERTGVSRPTAAAGLSELEDAGWIAELDPVAPGMGRPAKRYAFVSDAGVIVGVDMGLHSIRVLVHDLSERSLIDYRVANDAHEGSAEQFALLTRTVRDALADIGNPQLIAIAVGIPGVVDTSGRISLCPPRQSWVGVSLGSLLTREFGCPAFVENDAMAAAVAERHWGVGRSADNFVYLLSGHRTSSALVVNGQVLRGSTGAAGMIGELPELEWDVAPGRLLADAGSADDDLIAVFRRAENGDQDAAVAVASYIDRLALGLAAVSLAIDPELVVLGGGNARAGDWIAPALRSQLHKRAKIISPRVEVSPLQGEATALGAMHIAYVAVERALNKLI